jgi:hemoglobin-like flavoprotein
MMLDVQELRRSFEIAVTNEPELTTRFYAILFDRNPELRPMFNRNDPRRQAQMLAEALAAVVDHLEDPGWLASRLGALGRKHVDYGVTPPMYDAVGAALLGALEEACGASWSARSADAWMAAYGAIRDLMLAGVVDHARMASS